MINSTENYNLAIYFFEKIVGRTVNEGLLKSTAEYISRLTSNGWKLEEIKNEIELFKKEYPDIIRNVYTLEQIMANKKPPSNLIEEGVFYYHNLLRITSKPARIKKDPKTGGFVKEEEPYYLEMIKTFTMDNLLEYWYKQSEQEPNENIIRKDKGRFEYLLGYYDIDEILFAIDIAQENRRIMKQKLLKNVFDLEKYMEEAKIAIKEKRSVSRINNVNKIIERVDRKDE